MNLLPDGQFMGRGLSFKCMKRTSFTALTMFVVEFIRAGDSVPKSVSE